MAKSKYETKVKNNLQLIEKWVEEGATDIQIATKLGIGKTTFYAYVNEHSELSELLKRGKAIADDKVESALFKNAIGYEYTETTKEPDDHGVLRVTKTVTKQAAPNTAAQIFWLKNRRADLWRDKQDISHSGAIDTGLNMRDLTTEELRKLAKADNTTV